MNVEEQLAQLQAQLISAQAEIQRLREQNDEMRERIRTQTETINRAKDINSVQRPSLGRVRRLAEAALMWVMKVPSSRGKGKSFDWLLTFGRPVGFDFRYIVCSRRFRSLREIWDILSQDFCLNDLFDSYLKKTGRPKPVLRQICCDFECHNFFEGGVLTQPQNSFEAWHDFAGAIPFSSE